MLELIIITSIVLSPFAFVVLVEHISSKY